MIALDTTAIIDFFRKDTNLKKVLDSLDDKFVTTVINYWEIQCGLNPKDSRFSEENEFYEILFNDLITFDLDKESIKKASEIFWELANSGQMIDDFDSIIAGSLITNGVTKLITRNKKHFQRIPNIHVIDY